MDDTGDKLESVEGTVKWFDPRKGYGFIVGPEAQDIFVHYTVIEGEGFRALSDGAKVRYDAERGEKGWRASRVARLESHAEQDKDEESAEVVVNRRTYSRTPRR